MENYPGVVDTTAPKLADSFEGHARKLGVEFARGKLLEINQREVSAKSRDRLTSGSAVRTIERNRRIPGRGSGFGNKTVYID